ncbi:Kinase phosphorylation domain containing protein [Hyaloscypha variabilis]
MDLLSSIRKEGSRGGVNFSWDDVQTSQHRENYLGHSLMAPVGRWQKGKDLSWYAKADDKDLKDGETAEEKKARERKEEIRKIKEAEEDALARALGLPVADRNVSGSNAITVGEVNRVVKEAGVGEDDGVEDIGKGKGFGDFVGKIAAGEALEDIKDPEKGGLVRNGRERDRKKAEDRTRSRSRERRHRRHRDRSRSGERRRHRSRSGDRHRHRRGREDREERRARSRSGERKDRRYRSRSPDRHRGRTDHGVDRGVRGGYSDRPRRSRSPDVRDRRERRERDPERHR